MIFEKVRNWFWKTSSVPDRRVRTLQIEIALERNIIYKATCNLRTLEIDRIDTLDLVDRVQGSDQNSLIHGLDCE